MKNTVSQTKWIEFQVQTFRFVVEKLIETHISRKYKYQKW